MLSLSVEEIDEASADDDDQGEDLGVGEVILSESKHIHWKFALYKNIQLCF